MVYVSQHPESRRNLEDLNRTHASERVEMMRMLMLISATVGKEGFFPDVHAGEQAASLLKEMQENPDFNIEENAGYIRYVIGAAYDSLLEAARSVGNWDLVTALLDEQYEAQKSLTLGKQAVAGLQARLNS